MAGSDRFNVLRRWRVRWPSDDEPPARIAASTIATSASSALLAPASRADLLWSSLARSAASGDAGYMFRNRMSRTTASSQKRPI
jgi:hypothetical protein